MQSIPKLPKRQPDSHKGTFGRLLLIGGSRGMAGSISLSGTAALRSGAGLVSIATAETVLATVAGFNPCYMTLPLREDTAAPGVIGPGNESILAEPLERSDCLAVGPGLRTTPATRELVEWLYTSFRRPMVIDADGINCLGQRTMPLSGSGGPRVLTPHPGEFSRLTRETPVDRTAAEALAKDLAAKDTVIVLKGHHTLVTDGETVYRNRTGNPGMATGGSGDVLTGIIAALIAQGMSILDAAIAGVYIHGRAGDLAAERLGQISMTASDIADYLPSAFCETM